MFRRNRTKVKSEGTTYTIPTAFHNVTLGQYVAWQKAQTNVQKCAAALNVSTKEAMKLIPQDVLKIVEAFAVVIGNESQRHVKVINLNGKKYGFIPNPERITSGEYAALDDYNKVTFADGEWDGLVTMMSILFRPVTFLIGDNYRIEPFDDKKIDEHKSDILTMSMADVNGALLFFSTYEIELLQNSQRFLREQSSEWLREMNQPLTNMI